MTRRLPGRMSVSLPSRPFLYFLLVWISGLLLFGLWRLVFWYQFHERMSAVSNTDLLRAFLIGARFDTIVVLVILLPVLLVLPWLPDVNRFSRRLIVSYATIMFSLSVLLLLADLRFFFYFDSHLNFQAIQGIDGGKTSWHLIVSESRFVPFMLLWVTVTAALWYLHRYLFDVTSRVSYRNTWRLQILYFVVFLALSFVGIRGRTSLSTINWGMAYVSQNHFLNQLGLNGIYMLGRAFSEEKTDPRLAYLPEEDRFPFVSFKTGMDTVRTLLGQPDETWQDDDSTLIRTTHQPEASWGFRPNIVIVLEESWSGRNTGALGSQRNLTPHFDRLAQEGLLFTQFFATGTRTNYGMPGVLCSFPALPGRSVMTRYNALHPFRALSEILHERGYHNAFAYGGDLVFDNCGGFFRTKQFDRLYGDQELGPEKVLAKWGIPDHVVFHEMIVRLDSFPRPFQLTVLTLSNHEPFDLPDSSVQRYFDRSDSSMVFNAQLYADYALGRFIDEFRTHPAFDSTIFVVTADHAKFRGGSLAVNLSDFQIPLLIYGPSLLGAEARRIDKIGGQTDVLPTLMGLLGGNYTHQSWGRNLLLVPPDDHGFTTMNSTSCIAYLERDYFYLEALGEFISLYDRNSLSDEPRDISRERPDDLARLQRRLRILMQIAEQSTTPLVR